MNDLKKYEEKIKAMKELISHSTPTRLILGTKINTISLHKISPTYSSKNNCIEHGSQSPNDVKRHQMMRHVPQLQAILVTLRLPQLLHSFHGTVLLRARLFVVSNFMTDAALTTVFLWDNYAGTFINHRRVGTPLAIMSWLSTHSTRLCGCPLRR